MCVCVVGVGGWVCVCAWWVCVCVGEGVIYKFAGALFLMAINFCK